MRRSEVLLQYLMLAEQIVQKQYVPARTYAGNNLGTLGGLSEPEKFVTVRNAEEVIAAAEKIRAWCEPPASPGKRAKKNR